MIYLISKSILTWKIFFGSVLIFLISSSTTSNAQCACTYFDANDDFVCVLLSNCGNSGSMDCSNFITSSNISACPCAQTATMNSNCGACRSNGACWYNGTPCNPTGVCDLLTEIVTLPVSLTLFKGTNINDYNELVWKTDSEINNDYYFISHSINGREFEELYTLPGAGNSSLGLSYRFIHADPLQVINYYKLTQVDYDGQSVSYGPISIDNRDQKRELIKVCNLLGQEVNVNFRGIVIYHYDDGTFEKIYR